MTAHGSSNEGLAWGDQAPPQWIWRADTTTVSPPGTSGTRAAEFLSKATQSSPRTGWLGTAGLVLTRGAMSFVVMSVVVVVVVGVGDMLLGMLGASGVTATCRSLCSINLS